MQSARRPAGRSGRGAAAPGLLPRGHRTVRRSAGAARAGLIGRPRTAAAWPCSTRCRRRRPGPAGRGRSERWIAALNDVRLAWVRGWRSPRTTKARRGRSRSGRRGSRHVRHLPVARRGAGFAGLRADGLSRPAGPAPSAARTVASVAWPVDSLRGVLRIPHAMVDAIVAHAREPTTPTRRAASSPGRGVRPARPAGADDQRRAVADVLPLRSEEQLRLYRELDARDEEWSSSTTRTPPPRPTRAGPTSRTPGNRRRTTCWSRPGSRTDEFRSYRIVDGEVTEEAVEILPAGADRASTRRPTWCSTVRQRRLSRTDHAVTATAATLQHPRGDRDERFGVRAHDPAHR